MSIEDRVVSHYHEVEIDDGAAHRLQSLITDLAGEPAPEPARSLRLIAVGVTTVIVAGCVAGAVWASRTPQPSHGAAGGRITPGPVSITNTGPGLPQKTGFIGVTNARGVDGLIRADYANDVQLRASSAAGDARLNSTRHHLTVVLALFDANGRRVIGEWNPGYAKNELAIQCPHRDGVAFRLPAESRLAYTSPVQAARNLDRDLSLAGFGSNHAPWTVATRTATEAVVTTAATTLHATALPNGTWAITSGQRCTT